MFSSFLFRHPFLVQVCALKCCAVAVTASPTRRLATSLMGLLVWITTNVLQVLQTLSCTLYVGQSYPLDLGRVTTRPCLPGGKGNCRQARQEGWACLHLPSPLEKWGRVVPLLRPNSCSMACCQAFTKPPLFQRNRLTGSGNPSFESCVEEKAQQRERVCLLREAMDFFLSENHVMEESWNFLFIPIFIILSYIEESTIRFSDVQLFIVQR